MLTRHVRRDTATAPLYQYFVTPRSTGFSAPERADLPHRRCLNALNTARAAEIPMACAVFALRNNPGERLSTRLACRIRPIELGNIEGYFAAAGHTRGWNPEVVA